VPYRFASVYCFHSSTTFVQQMAGIQTLLRNRGKIRVAVVTSSTHSHSKWHVRHSHTRACCRSWRCWADYISSRGVQRERQRVAALRCFGSLVQRSVRGWRQHVALLRRGREARAKFLVRPQSQHRL